MSVSLSLSLILEYPWVQFMFPVCFLPFSSSSKITPIMNAAGLWPSMAHGSESQEDWLESCYKILTRSKRLPYNSSWTSDVRPADRETGDQFSQQVRSSPTSWLAGERRRIGFQTWKVIYHCIAAIVWNQPYNTPKNHIIIIFSPKIRDIHTRAFVSITTTTTTTIQNLIEKCLHINNMINQSYVCT